MSRPLRIEFPGARYHVTARGNEQKAIVRDNLDRQDWVETFELVCARFDWRCLAWCLMDNHLHIVLETTKANLARGMQLLNGRHAQRFNARHCRVGHLFQGRYKALLTQNDGHLLEACRYVVLNPERIEKPRCHGTWRWSSYRATVGLEPAPQWLDIDQLLGHFAPDRALAQRRYRAFIQAGLESAVGGLPVESDIYLAGRAYIRLRGGDPSGSRETPAIQREPIVVPLERRLRDDGNQAIALAYRDGFRLREIADAMGFHYSTISRRLAAQERTLRR